MKLLVHIDRASRVDVHTHRDALGKTFNLYHFEGERLDLLRCDERFNIWLTNDEQYVEDSAVPKFVDDAEDAQLQAQESDPEYQRLMARRDDLSRLMEQEWKENFQLCDVSFCPCPAGQAPRYCLHIFVRNPASPLPAPVLAALADVPCLLRKLA